MRIAIARPEFLGAEWEPFPTDPFMTPAEIRRGLKAILDAEDAELDMDPSSLDRCIVTMNRTVLDGIRSQDMKDPGRIVYDDVYVWDGEKLVPLLDLHEEAWLCHFSLGDLLERSDLWESK